MAVKTESEIIADILASTNQLARFFISKLDADRIEERISVNGVELNSAYWLIAHMIWAEKYLCLEGTGAGKQQDLDWADHYGLGSSGELHDGRPDFKTLYHTLKEVHERSLAHIKGLTDSDLDKEPTLPVPVGKDIRSTLYHAIRHEGQHVGHISWLVRMQGGKVI